MTAYAFKIVEANWKHPTTLDGSGLGEAAITLAAATEHALTIDCGTTPVAGSTQPRSGKTTRLIQFIGSVEWGYSHVTGAYSTKAKVPANVALTLRMSRTLNVLYVEGSAAGSFWFIVVE